MITAFILGISIVLLLFAVVLTVRLALKTGKKTAWTLIGAAALLMAARQTVVFSGFLFEKPPQADNLNLELINLVLAGLLVGGIAVISRFLLAMSQSEQELKSNIDFSRHLIEHASDGVFLHNLDGKFVEVNQYACSMLGYTREELIGMSIQQVEMTYDPKSFQTIWQRLNRGIPVTFDGVGRRKDGTAFPVEASLGLIHQNGSSLILSLVRDTSARKQTEYEYTRRTQYLENLLVVSREITTTKELPALFRNVIRTSKDLLHLDFSTLMLLNESKDQLVMEDTIGFPESTIGTLSLMEGQGLSSFVVKNKASDTVLDFSLENRFSVPQIIVDKKVTSAICVPLTLNDEVLGVLIGHMHDKREFTHDELSLYQNIANQAALAITNSRNLKALEESELKYRDLYDRAPDMYHSLNKDGIIIDCNETEADMLGYRKEDIIGRPLTDFLTDESKRHFKKQFASLTEENVQLNLERVFVRKDGSVFPAALNVFAEFDDEGALIKTRTIARDVSERVKMEEELLKAQKLESIGILAGGLAHDFNNMLAGILGNVSLARLYADSNGKVTERLDEAEKASLRARDLTQQLLTFSKGGEPVKKPTAVAEVIKESSSFALRGSNVRCEYSIPEDLWPVEIDEGQINQAISNLIINGDQAMPQGGTIRIACENVLIKPKASAFHRKGKYIRITIKDHGVGVAAEHIGKIFDPYFTTKQKGSGLGLTTTYSIISKHEGYVFVKSKVGKGTSFEIYLPASRKKIKPDDEIEGEIIRGTGRILVMDDEEVVRGVTGEILKDLGYEVEYAKEGAEAIELYKQSRKANQPFNAVIMDLTIPGGMGGKETIDHLLQIDPEVRAIVSSGYSNDPVMANHEKYGFLGVVTKPCKVYELSRVLHSAMNDHVADHA